MKPVRLELEGFGSYAARTTVDFAGITAAAIVGGNGAGKSTLVQALAWALYGRGRYSTADGFISDGASECRVTFDFELSGQTYRVERQRSLTGRGGTALQLARIVDGWGEDALLEPIAGGHVAEVQRAIEQLLGLGYDEWLCTSFISQNGAGRFAELPPGQRKALLADILQVGKFQARAEYARSQERVLTGELQGVSRRIEETETFLTGEADARDMAEMAERQRVELAGDVTALEAAMEAARSDLEAARRDSAALVQARERLGELRAGRRREAERLAIEAARARNEQRQAEEEREATRDAVARLEASSALAPDLEQEAERAHQGAADHERERESWARRAAELEASAATYGAQATAAGGQIPKISGRIDALARSDDTACYACGQPLTAEHRDQMIRDLHAETDRLMEQAREANRIGQEEGEEAYKATRKSHEAYEAGKAALTLAQETERALDRALAAGEQLSVEQGRLEILEERLQDLAAQLQEIQDHIAAAEPPGQEERALEEQAVAGAGLDKRIEQAQAETSDLQGRLRVAQQGAETAVAAAARASAELERFDRVRTDLTGLRADRTEKNRARERQAFWAQAYGRDGLPALVIENAIPAIAAEANDLLHQFTAGRLSVRLESLRANRDGGIRETLDILVSDGAGAERPLEGFSGGEQQMCFLALAIALARVLAHRAGRRIELLVVDEALTALDAEHRQRSIEILHYLQGEFSCLLFVTHLSGLAEAFPTRIQVTKDESGSRVEVRGAGIEVAA